MAAALPAVLDNECFCPVCLEEFHEPKSLPSCAHNVCKPCLQNMVPNGEAYISCPICRMQSNLPPGGVDGLPTNRLVLKLLDATPGRRERAEIRRLLDECRTKISNLQRSTENRETRTRAIMAHGRRLKREIVAASSKLTEAIRQKETELCGEVDRLFGIAGDEGLEQQESETFWIKWFQTSQEFVHDAEDILREESLTDTLKRRERLVSLAKDILSTECEVCDSPKDTSLLSLTFSLNREVFRQVEDEGIGKLTPGDETDGTAHSNVDNVYHETSPSEIALLQRTVSRSLSTQSASIDITVSARDIGLESLSPLSVSSSPQGDIALADPTRKRVLILNSEGRHKKTFNMSCCGVAFSCDGQGLAVCHSREVRFIGAQAGSLLHVLQGFENRLRTVSYAGTDRLILTSEPPSLLQKACVCVCRIGTNVQLDIEHRFYMAGSPFKAIHHNQQFFVSNTSKGCIMIYNEHGQFVRKFGKKKHGSGALTSPMGLAMHPWNNQLLVCDQNTSSIQMYETNGMFVEKFAVGGSPSDVTILQDGTIVVCSQTNHWVKYFSV